MMKAFSRMALKEVAYRKEYYLTCWGTATKKREVGTLEGRLGVGINLPMLLEPDKYS